MHLCVLRYRMSKPADGKLEFSYHRDGTILGFQEFWSERGEPGWEVVLDILVDTSIPVERRRFFLCTGGDDLTPLGEQAFAYHIGTNAQKGYASYLFDITHLPDQMIDLLSADRDRLRRTKPGAEELSYKAKQVKARKEREERIARDRSDNERRRAERIAHEREATDRIVAEREAAAQERAALEGPELRLVDEA
jgi:hypothetical protein